jgi:hypothetical protein
MLVKIHSRGKGGGSGPIDYLMGKDRKREHATLLRGNIEQTHQLIDSLSFSRNYTSGVISFEEKDIPASQKEYLMDELEKTLLCGLDANQYDCLWIEHQDKGRLELNFLIPNVELQTGKRLQPYYDKVDKKRKDAFQIIMNDKFNLSDPNDPSKSRLMSYRSDLPKGRKEAMEHITNALNRFAAVGEISCRNDVINSLQGNGFDVARQTKNSISIRLPGEKRNLRLTGGIYEHDFRASKGVRAAISETIEQYSKNNKQRVSKAKRVYTDSFERVAAYNSKKYEPARTEYSKRVNAADKKLRESCEKLGVKSNDDVLERNSNSINSVQRCDLLGLQISNHQLQPRIAKYERDTETANRNNQNTRASISNSSTRTDNAFRSISNSLKSLGTAIERYAAAAIKRSAIYRTKRENNRPTFRPRW